MNAFRPILLSSCSRAATAEELRFRIDRPIVSERGVRVVALDAVAARVVASAAAQPWNAARFFVGAHGAPTNGDSVTADVLLRAPDGSEAFLSDEMVGAHVMVLVAAADGDGATGSAIGRACARQGVMTAGVILGDTRDTAVTVSALRPQAQVLLITSDEQDVSEVLTALRA